MDYKISVIDKIMMSVMHRLCKKKIPNKLQRITDGYPKCDALKRYYVEKYYNLRVGKYTTFYDDLLEDSSAIESIGAFCSIAKNVHFTEGNHPLTCVTTSAILYNKHFGFVNDGGADKLLSLEKRNGPSKVGNDVWIGRDVTILPSVTIGDGAVIGAGALVNSDIPPYAIAVGVPAKIIRYRFDQEHIEKMLKLKWWQWPDDVIREKIDNFFAIDDFCHRVQK